MHILGWYMNSFYTFPEIWIYFIPFPFTALKLYIMHAICSIFSALNHPRNRCTYYRWDMNLFYSLSLSLHPNCISCMLFEVYFQLWINQGIDAHTIGEIWISIIPYPFHCTQILYHACYVKYIFSSESSKEYMHIL